MASRLNQNVGTRRLVLVAIALVGLLALNRLGITWGEAFPIGESGTSLREFFAAAVSPELSNKTLTVTREAVLTTVRVAALATAVSVVVGLVLGFLGSTAWWPVGARRHPLRLVLFVTTRFFITLMRSIHELLWAMLFLLAIGITHTTGVIAIAIPFSGTFAKIFSEMIDEAPRAAGDALGAAGASPLRVYLFGLLPQALPDILAYTLYRFECALRASAVMGFFGVTTLGYYLMLAFEDLNYSLVWTYLYALILLVIIFDVWSASARRRLTH